MQSIGRYFEGNRHRCGGCRSNRRIVAIAMVALLSFSERVPLCRAAAVEGPAQSAQTHKERTGAQAVAAGASVQLQTVTVTGTHLTAPNPTQPMVVMTSEDIERDGYTTTEQLFRALPAVFGGGDSGATPDGIYGFGSHADLNITGATGVNLFGLGASATLVLVDGRRLTPTIYGQFADVSMIPLSAIERIDIITDGSSAIYGADAVAGVVNVILKHNYRGADTSIIAGDTTGGGSEQFTVSQSGGTEWDTGSLSGSVEYVHQGALAASERPDVADALLSPSDLYPKSTMYSGTVHGEQRVGDELKLSLDGMVTEKNVGRLMNSSVSGMQSFSEIVHNAGMTVGANYGISPGWSVETSLQFGRDELENDSQFPAYPTMQLSRSMENVTLTELSPDLMFRGNLFKLPGGVAAAAIGASYRSDRFMDRDVDVTSGDSAAFGPLDRQVHSEYAELELPVIGPANGVSAIRALDVSLALRHDAYSDVGATTNPRFGVRWSPVRDLSLRSSWGTSFTPPTQLEMIGGIQQTYLDIYPITAPSGVGTVPAYIAFGGSQPLKPERAHTLDLGGDLDLPHAGLKAAFDYLHVLYEGRIIKPPFLMYALTQPNIYGPLIQPLESDAASAAYLSSAIAQGWIVEDFIGTGSTGVRYIYDTRQRNAQDYLAEAYQLNISETRTLGSSILHATLQALIMGKLEASYAAGTSAAELLNTFGYPVKTRVRLEMGWERGSWNLGGAINYTGGYTNNEIMPSPAIASWTTLDFHLGYRTGGRLRAVRLDDIKVDLNVINALDRSPPFVNRAIPADNVNYDVANANPLGRVVSIGITKQW